MCPWDDSVKRLRWRKQPFTWHLMNHLILPEPNSLLMAVLRLLT